MNRLLLSLAAVLAMLAPELAMAAESSAITTIKTQITGWYGSEGFITVIGSALVLAAAAAVAFKWIKGMLFG